MEIVSKAEGSKVTLEITGWLDTQTAPQLVGKELKNKLGVRAYPSFFIIRPDGTVQHAVVGGDRCV